MRYIIGKVSSVWAACLVVTSLFTCGGTLLFLQYASADELGNRTLQLSNSYAGNKGATYNTSFQIATQGTLGSIEFEFCSNSTFPTDVCDPPTGMDASGAVFSSESGISGFTIRSETANDVVISRPPAPTLPVTANVLLDNITNPMNDGSYYLRVLTYASNDASGPTTDTGGMAFAINPAVGVKVQVPPYLLFCTGNTISGTDCTTASGNFIELGQLLTTKTSSGQSQMVVATNAQTGYNISATGTTLTSGNNTIPSLATSTPSQVGVSQFGINLRANTKPSIGADPTGSGTGQPTPNYDQSNLYRYNNGEVVASNNTVEDGRKYTVSYITNISNAQPPGIYASTFTYVALGNF